jgi:LysM repeat protein
MRQLDKRRLFGILAVFTAVFITSCYQGASQGEQPTPISQLIPTNTMAPSATPSPSPAGLPTTSVTPNALAQAFPTSTVLVFGAESGSTPDPFQLTATRLYEQLTATVETGLTMTAAALGIGSSPTPTFGFFPTATPTPFTQTGTCTHTVQAGENLWRISQRYGVTVAALASANGIANMNLVVVGQQLVIPGCGTTGVVPPGTAYPTADPGTGGGGFVPTQAPQPSGITHVVQQGETLFSISLRYGVNMYNIAYINNISDVNRILMNTTLQIPNF